MFFDLLSRADMNTELIVHETQPCLTGEKNGRFGRLRKRKRPSGRPRAMRSGGSGPGSDGGCICKCPPGRLGAVPGMRIYLKEEG